MHAYIVFLSKGCSWLLNKQGGATHCVPARLDKINVHAVLKCKTALEQPCDKQPSFSEWVRHMLLVHACCCTRCTQLRHIHA